MSGEAEVHLCEEPGCNSLCAFECVLDFDDDSPSYYCSEHAFKNGFCCICGQFWSGIESFDFGPGYCENCRSQVEGEEDCEDGEFDIYYEEDF